MNILIAVLYVCVYVDGIIPYHYMLLIKCVMLKLIGAEKNIFDSC